MSTNVRVFVYCLLVGFTSSLAAQEDSRWLNKQFMPAAQAKFMLPSGQVPTGNIGIPFTVTQVKGDWLWMGQAWVKMTEVVALDEAPDYFTRYLQTYPNDSEAHVHRGIAREALGDTSRAMGDYNQAIQLAPRYARNFLTRGSAYYRKEDFTAAIKDFSEAIRLNPQWAKAYKYRGVARLGQDPDSEQALEDFNQAIRLDPKYAEAYIARGQLHADWFEDDEALRNYTKAIELNPKNAFAYHLRGDLHHGMGHIKAALDDYNRAIALDPTKPIFFLERGEFSVLHGDGAAALKDFAEVIRLAPEKPEGYRERANLLAMCHDARYRDGKLAVADAKKACELTQWKDDNCLETLAVAYAEAGDFASAIEWITKAMEAQKDKFLMPSVNQLITENRQKKLELFRSGQAFHLAN